MEVWVTRPHPASATTAAAIRAGGHTAIEIPVIEVTTMAPDPKPASRPDWIILVSANAARGLAAAGVDVVGARFAAVGRRTAEVAAELGFAINVVPTDEYAEGLIAALEGHPLQGKRVWIPAGDRPGSANRRLPDALTRLGATAEVFRVYETRDRPLSPDDLATLARHPPGAITVHSPSAAEAVYAGQCPTAVAAWRERAVAIAIGPVTRVRLQRLGVERVTLAQEPSDAGVLTALTELVEMKS